MEIYLHNAMKPLLEDIKISCKTYIYLAYLATYW